MHTMTKPSTRQLWHLRGSGSEGFRTAPTAFIDGLTLHVANAALVSVLMQIGATQQSYVAMRGCSGCERGRCESGCHVDMFQRLLDRHGTGLTLQHVTGGLATRPYTRVVVAVPGRHAQLHSELLHPWPEARLVVSWQPGKRGSIQMAALLLVGADGPSPCRELRARGWQPWPVLTAIARRWACAPIPPTPLLKRSQRGVPTLLLPARRPLVCPPAAALSRDSGLDTQLTVWLTSLLAHPNQPAEEVPTPPQDATPSPWPTGPGTLAPAALGTLVAQLIAEPSFQSTRKGQSGLSKGRLAGLKYAGLSENVARALMVWFDRAGVLASPEDGQGPWRAPRPFALTDPEQIAAKLRDTSLPTNEEIRAAYGGET
jgi:hypothetical protein